MDGDSRDLTDGGRPSALEIHGVRLWSLLTLGMSLSRSSLKASLSPKNTRLASLPNGVASSSQLPPQHKTTEAREVKRKRQKEGGRGRERDGEEGTGEEKEGQGERQKRETGGGTRDESHFKGHFKVQIINPTR